MKRDQFDQMLAKASNSVQALNREIAEVCPRPGDNPIMPFIPDTIPLPKKRIRQNSKPLSNKLEAEFGDYLHRMNWSGNLICEQAITVRLANGLRYTPDWCVLSSFGVRCYEVKGKHIWDDSIAKLKMAAALYFHWRWNLVWKEGEVWKQQLVLP